MPIPLATPGAQPAFQAAVQRPYAGSGHSLQGMQRMALAGERDPQVRRWAVEVIREVTPRDYLSEAAALFYEVCRTVRYTRDPVHTELVQHPRVALQQRSGDCDCIGVLQAAGLAASVGAEAEFVAVGFRSAPFAGPDPYTHVFLRIRDPKSGRWAILDPVAGPHTPIMLRRVVTRRIAPSGVGAGLRGR